MCMCVCVCGWVGGGGWVSCASMCDMRKHVRTSMRVCIIGFQCSVNDSGYCY